MNDKIQVLENDIELFDSQMDILADEYCSKYQLENLHQATQSQWNGFMMYCNKSIFSKYNLKAIPENIVNNSTNNTKTNYNKYNYNLLLEILNNIYIPYCMNYSKECSIIGFSLLVGCDNATIQAWGNNEPSTPSFAIYKKLCNFREESLSNKLATGNKNPVGIMAILNHQFSWNMPGVTRETVKREEILISDTKTAFESFQLEQKNT